MLGLPLGIVLFLTRKGQLLENNFIIVFSLFWLMYSGLFLYHTYCLDDSFYKSTGGNFHWNLGSTCSTKYWLRSVYCKTCREQPFGGSKWIDRNGKSSWRKSTANYQQSFTSRALPSLINNATITLITLVGYSAMGGAVGAGGLGQVGYQYGYIGYNAVIMNTVLLLLIAGIHYSVYRRQTFKNSIIDKIKQMKRFTLLSLITIALLFLYSCTNAKKIILILLKWALLWS